MRSRVAFLVSIVTFSVVTATSAQTKAQEAPTARDLSPPTKADTEARKARIAERDRLAGAAKGFTAAGKLDGALATLHEVLIIERELFGDTHEEVAGTLDWMAEIHEQREDWPAARKARGQILGIKAALYGDDHWRVTDARLALRNLDLLASLSAANRERLREAERLNRQVVQFYQQGKYREAIPIAESIRQTRLELLGEQHARYAEVLNNLALLYESVSDYPKAKLLYLQVRAIDSKTLGEQHPTFAVTLNNLAGICQSMGEYAEAESLYLQTRSIRQKTLGEQHSSYAITLNNLATLYRSMGDYARAEPLYLQARDIRKKTLGEQHPSYAITLNNLAVLYESIGDYAKAESLYLQTRDIRKKTLGEQHPDYAQALSNLGGLYRATGDSAQAEALFTHALEIKQKALGEQHPSYAITLNNLALLYESIGDYAEAEPLYLRVREIESKTLGEQHPSYATTLNNLAELYRLMNDPAKAQPLLVQALAIKRETIGEQHPSYATTLNNLAALYQSTANYAMAEPVLLQALDIRLRTLEAAVTIQSERQQLRMATELEGSLHNYVSAGVNAGKLGRRQYEHVLRWKGAVTRRQRLLRAAAESADGAALFARLAATATRLSTLTSRSPEPKQVAAFRRQFTELSEEKERIEKELSAASSEARRALAPTTLEQLASALPPDAALIDFLEYRHLDFRPTNKSPQNRMQATQRRIAAFVIRPGPRVDAVVLPMPAAEIAKLVADSRTRFGQARGNLAALNVPASAVLDDPAVKLRQAVWEPIEGHLNGLHTILISPDGGLCRLVFAALPGRKPGSFLIEDYSIAVVPEPQTLPALAERRALERTTKDPAARKPVKSALLLVGDVNYDAEASQEARPKRAFAARKPEHQGKYESLEATRGEIAAIAKTFDSVFETGGVKTLEGSAASEAAFRELAAKHYYLHVATHGFFAPERFRSIYSTGEANAAQGGRSPFGEERPFDLDSFHPGLLSGLVLASANRPVEEGRDDGILTAEEVATMNLDGVELVTLSACETGLGAVAGGEGLLGLQRAFQISGARTVISSMWRVPDNETRMLMERFYRNLWEKEMTKLDALREAQLWMLNGADGNRGEIRKRLDATKPNAASANLDPTSQRLPPYYWAGFVLSGDWQ